MKNSKVLFSIIFTILLISFTSAAFGNSLDNGLVHYFNMDDTNWPYINSSMSSAYGKIEIDTTWDNTEPLTSINFSNAGILDESIHWNTSITGPVMNMSFNTFTINQTISMWVKPETITAGNEVGFLESFAGTSYRERIYIDRGGYLLWDVYGVGEINASVKLTANVWNNIIAFKGTGGQKIYLNNVLVGSNANEGVGFTAGTLWLGGTYQTQSSPKGFMDEVGFWNRSLSTIEITQLWNSGAGCGYNNCSGDIILPTYSSVSVNNTVVSEMTRFSITVADNNELGWLIFSTNNTGSWINDTLTNLSGFSGATQTNDLILNETKGNLIGYRWFLNDSSGNINNTIIYTLTTTNNSIVTCQDLQNMNGNLYEDYDLANNIDCTASSTWNGGRGFVPIGHSYYGIFDGHGYTITNLYIARSNESVGLFDTLYGTVRNVGLVNNSYWGGYEIGGITAVNVGNITNSYTTGPINGYNLTVMQNRYLYIGGLAGTSSNGNITNSFTNGTIYAGGYNAGTYRSYVYAGGLIGYDIGGNIFNSYSKSPMTVTSTNTIYTGGLIGFSTGIIHNCSSSGYVETYINSPYVSGDTNIAYAGGLIGYASGVINNSYSISNVSNTIDAGDDDYDYYYTGGLAGFNAAGGKINNTYAKGNVSSSNVVTNYADIVGGLVGLNYGSIYTSYSIGKVSNSGGSYSGTMKGGLVGASNLSGNWGNATNSYWDVNLSSLTDSEGGWGKTTIQMKDVRTYTNEGWSTDCISKIKRFLGFLWKTGVVTTCTDTLGVDGAWDFYGDPFDDVANESIWGIDNDTTTNFNSGFPYFYQFNATGIPPFENATYPQFVTVSADSWINYDQSLVSGNFTFFDEGGLDGLWLNYSENVFNFTWYTYSIEIVNQTTLNVGTYLINISINNTDGLINSTLYKVTVNKSTSGCVISFNETSPQTFPSSFRVTTNCKTTYNLTRNNTEILNNSIQALAVGAYNFSIQRNDTTNYSVIFDSEEFRVTPAVAPPSTYLHYNSSDTNDTTSWRMLGRTLNRTSYDYVGYTAPTTSLKVVSLGDRTFSTPIIVNGFVYITDETGKLYKFNATNISLAYTDGGIIGGYSQTLIIVEDMIYSLSSDALLSRINATNLTFMDDYGTGALTTDSTPVIANGYVYFVDSSGTIYQINTTNLSLYKSYDIGTINFDYSTPAISNDYIYVGDDDDVLYQFDATNVSNLIATFNTTGRIVSSPAIKNDYVYVGSNSGYLFQLNATNISIQIANFSTGSVGESSVAIDGDYAYIGNNGFYQLNATNVSQQIYNYSQAVDYGPVISGDYAYVVDNNYIYQFNKTNVSRKTGYYNSSLITSFTSLAIANNYIYAGGRLGGDTGYIYQIPISSLAILPTVTILLPTTGETFADNDSITLNYSITSNGYNIDSCWYKVTNETGVQKDNTTLPSCNNVSFGMVAGNYDYNLTLYGNDTVGNLNSAIVQFGVRTEGPAINLFSPTNNQWLSNKTSIFFNYTAANIAGISRCNLWGNWSGGWHLNYSWINPTNVTMNYTQVTINDGDLPYIYNVWCNDTLNQANWATNNFTFNIDTVFPKVGFTTLNNIAYTSLSLTLGLNVTELNKDNCTFDLRNSTGDLHNYAANTTINCSATTLSISTLYAGTFTFRLWIKDKAGNLNNSMITFTTSVPIGGEQGGGGVTVIVGNLSWSMSTENGGNRYQFNMLRGTSRNREILFENLGVEPLIISLDCQYVNGSKNLCDYVSYEYLNFDLPVEKGVKVPIGFTITIPEDFEKDDYVVNLEAMDDKGNLAILTTEVNVETFGPLIKLSTKLTSSKLFGTIKIAYFWIFLFLLLILSTIFSYVYKKGKIKANIGIGTITGLFLTFIILFFI